MNIHSDDCQKILFVDDNVDIQTVMALSLRQRGFDVVTVGSAKTALAAFGLNHFSLVIIDYGLPDLNGISLGKQIIELETAPSLRLILLTGNQNFQLAEQARRVGFSEFLVKPIQMQLLIESIQSLGIFPSSETKL